MKGVFFLLLTCIKLYFNIFKNICVRLFFPTAITGKLRGNQAVVLLMTLSYLLELDSGAHQDFSLPQEVTEGDF